MILEKERAKVAKARIMRAAGNDLLALSQFTTAQIAAATGVPAETIRTWFKRGILSLDDDNMGEEPQALGFGRSFTGYMAMTVAIMGRLMSTGMPAQDAKRAANRFVHSGDSVRRPCNLFAEGVTCLMVPRNAPGEGRAIPQVMNLLGNDDLLLLMNKHHLTQVEFLLLDELWQTIFQRLGIRDQVETA